MKRFVAGAAGTLMVASVLMAGAGNASASARKPAPKPVVSVSHFAGDTLTLSAVAGPRNTITVKVKFEVTAGQARDPWVLGAFRSEDSLGSQMCGCDLFGSTAVSWTSPPLVFKGKKAMRTFQETDVMERIMKPDGLSATNGFHVSVTNTKTGVSGWVDINSVPPAPKPVVSVSHFEGDTLTLSAVAGPKNTIKVTVKLSVTADQAGDPWVMQALRTDGTDGGQVCDACLDLTDPVFKGNGAMRTFKETAVMVRSNPTVVTGAVVSVTNTKTGVSGWVSIDSVPVR